MAFIFLSGIANRNRLDNLMKHYEAEIDRNFTMQDFAFIKNNLMHVMAEYKAKPRGNIARFVLAVHTILKFSEFKCTRCENHIEMIPNYRFQPSDLCYTYTNDELEGSITIKFSFCEENVDMVTVSGIVVGANKEENVYETTADLMKYASALIECLHGAIADSSEKKLVQFWSHIYKDICVPLLCDLKRNQLMRVEKPQLAQQCLFFPRDDFIDNLF